MRHITAEDGLWPLGGSVYLTLMPKVGEVSEEDRSSMVFEGDTVRCSRETGLRKSVTTAFGNAPARKGVWPMRSPGRWKLPDGTEYAGETLREVRKHYLEWLVWGQVLKRRRLRTLRQWKPEDAQALHDYAVTMLEKRYRQQYAEADDSEEAARWAKRDADRYRNWRRMLRERRWR